MSFQELLNLIRVEASEIQLLESTKRISEIAKNVGFSATRYYNKFFQKWYGMPPEEYRQHYSMPANGDPDIVIYNSSEGYKSLNDFIQDGRIFIKALGESPTSIINVDINRNGLHFVDPLIHSVKISNATSFSYENLRLIIENVKRDFKIVKTGIDVECLTYVDSKDNSYMRITSNINYLLQEGMDVQHYSIYINGKKNIEKANFNNFRERLSDRIRTIIKAVPQIELITSNREELVFTTCLYDSFVLAPFSMD